MGELQVDVREERVEGRGTLTFPVDVELRSIRWAADATPHGHVTTRIAVDQPPGFWDALDEHGAFLAAPIVAAGRAIDVRIVRPSEQPIDIADLDLELELRFAPLKRAIALRWPARPPAP
jgi:hypothetical protein